MTESQVPTLTYLALHGKGDPIRALLYHKGITFTNRALSFEEFGERKAAGEFPTGQVPIW